MFVDIDVPNFVENIGTNVRTKFEVLQVLKISK